MNEDRAQRTDEGVAGRCMSDAQGDGEEADDSATLASAFEAALEDDRRDQDRAFELMQERATEGGLNATGASAGALPELGGARLA